MLSSEKITSQRKACIAVRERIAAHAAGKTGGFATFAPLHHRLHDYYQGLALQTSLENGIQVNQGSMMFGTMAIQTSRSTV